MKNLKNMLTAVAMTAVLGVGTVSANSGFIITDKSANTTKPCAVKDGGILQQMSGIIIVGLSGFILSDLHGLIMSDAPTVGCDNNGNGLIMSDRDGFHITD